MGPQLPQLKSACKTFISIMPSNSIYCLSESMMVCSLGIPYPLCNSLSLLALLIAFSLGLHIFHFPWDKAKSFLQAIKVPKWCDAMHAESDALEVNHTSTLTGPPLDKKSIGCKCVYKIIKYNLDSFVQQFNSQPVTTGYYQENGLDYFVTFAPIAKSVIDCTCPISLLSIQGWHLHQLEKGRHRYGNSLNIYIALNKLFKKWFAKFSLALLDAGYMKTTSTNYSSDPKGTLSPLPSFMFMTSS